MFRAQRTALLMAAVWALLPAGPAAMAATGSTEGPRLSFWCEFMPYAEVLPVLPVLARYGCDLLLHVERKDVGDPDMAAVYRRAQELHVDVAAWFLFPLDEHLYVGEETLDATEALAHRFLDWAEAEKLTVRWLVFDCEPSFVLGKDLIREARRRSLRGVGRVLRAERDPAKFACSLRRLNGILDGLRARGVRILGAGNRVFLDAARFGNVTLEDTLGVPFTMASWDRVSFITYRYMASQANYRAFTHHYAVLARRYFGAEAALDLGLVGSHRDVTGHRERAAVSVDPAYYMSFLDGMQSLQDLQDVIGTALARGLRNINLFSLDGAVDSAAGLEAWLQAASESRPARGWVLGTRLRSAQLTFTSRLAEYLFRMAVGRARYELDSPPARADPL